MKITLNAIAFCYVCFAVLACGSSKDDVSTINQSLGKSAGTGTFSPVGDVDPDDELSDSTSARWSVAVVWNGFKSIYSDDEVNYLYHKAGSRVGLNHVECSTDRCTGTIAGQQDLTQYNGSESSTDADLTYTHFSAVAYNRRYMQVFSESSAFVVYDSNSSGSLGTFNLDPAAAAEDNFTYAGKKAFVLLTGYQVEFFSNDADGRIAAANIRLRDHAASVSFDTPNIVDNGDGSYSTPSIQYSSNFRGTNEIGTEGAPDYYLLTLHYSVFVYDPAHIEVLTQDSPDDGDWELRGSSGSPTYELDHENNTTFSSSWASSANRENVFVGIKSFGWSDAESGWSLNALKNTASLDYWYESTQTAKIALRGISYKADASIRPGPDASRHRPPNATKTHAIVCRNSGVCKVETEIFDTHLASHGGENMPFNIWGLE
jgi:hypothetical protein